jgi:hypothetical protein
MIYKSMTYGVMPDWDTFQVAWDLNVPEDIFEFGNDKRVGNCSLTQLEVWDELSLAHQEYSMEGKEDSGDWCSLVLYSLGIEWI